MNYDLTFEEAIDVLQSKLGWVQGENFEKDEYLALDRRTNVFIKNFVNDKYVGCVFDTCGDQTREIWTNIKCMQEGMKNQKYRFILVLNRDSVKGEGCYSDGNDRNSYLWHKWMNTKKIVDEQNELAKKEICASIKDALKDCIPADKLETVDKIFYSAAQGYLFKRKEQK